MVSGKLDSHSPHPAAGRTDGCQCCSLPLHRWEGTRRLKLRMATQIRRLSSVLPRWPPPGNQPAPHPTPAPLLGTGREWDGGVGGSSSSHSHLTERKPQGRTAKPIVALILPAQRKLQPFYFLIHKARRVTA